MKNTNSNELRTTSSYEITHARGVETHEATYRVNGMHAGRFAPVLGTVTRSRSFRRAWSPGFLARTPDGRAQRFETKEQARLWLVSCA